MTPAEEPAEPPPAPKKFYLLVGKASIKGPFTADQLRENADFGAASRLARLGATKSSQWMPADYFEELRPVLEARKAAAAAAAAKAASQAKPG